MSGEEESKYLPTIFSEATLIGEVQDAIKRILLTIQVKFLLCKAFDLPLHPKIVELFDALEPLYKWHNKYHNSLEDVAKEEDKSNSKES